MSEVQHTGTNGHGLSEVKLAFIAAHERGEGLASWLERYPQHARVLIDLAMALDTGRRHPTPDAAEVAFAAKALRAALREVTDIPAPRAAASLAARARALGLRMPLLARRLRLWPESLVKIDQGFLQKESIPRHLLHQLAEVLSCPAEMILTWLPAAPRTASAQYYADRVLDPPRQESFAAALDRAQNLPEEDRQMWQSVLREEGLVS